MGKIDNIRNFAKKVKRFGWYIPLSNLILTYGQRFFSPNTLNRILENRTSKIQGILSQSIAFPTELERNSTKTDGKSARIWFFWLQGEENLPLVPKMCLQSIRKHANGHEVIVLNADNYHEYVTIPDELIELYRLGKMKAAHFADILRINLLAQQGGLWLDATMFVAQDLPEEIFEMPFFSIKTANQGYFVSQCRWAVFCLGARKGNPIFVQLASLFEQYLLKTDVFVDYFLFDNFIDMLYKRYPILKEQIDALPMNNPRVHDMAPLLCDCISDEAYSELVRDTYLFKLSYKSFRKEELFARPDNLYNRICICNNNIN